MQTNPRTRLPESWAPPPPVVVGDKYQQVVVHRPRVTQEEDFDATLGSLVEHFAALPPPQFGEPPDLPALEATVATPPKEPRRTTHVWLAAGSLLLGAAVAASAVVGLQVTRSKRAAAAAVAAPVVAEQKPAVGAAPAPEVAVKAPEAIPAPALQAAEPAAPEVNEPVVAAAPEKNEPAVPAVTEKPAPAKRSDRAVRKHRRSSVAAVATRKAPNEDWEDPYK